MFARKINVEWLSSTRLDTDYYNPVAITAIKKIHDFGQYYTFGESGEVWGFGAYELCNQIKEEAQNFSPRFIKIGDIEPPFVDVENALKITFESYEILSAAHVEQGDIIVSIAGTIGASAIVPASEVGLAANQAIVKYRPNRDFFNNYFVAAYTLTDFFKLIANKEAGGAIQKNLYMYNFSTIPIPKPSVSAQKYIGDKVLQAEQLRAWAKRLECSIDCLLTKNNDYLSACHTLETKSSRPQLNDLSNRLDPKYYGNKAIAVQRFARKKGVVLGDLIKSVANGFEERSFLKSGLAYITVSEVSSGRLNAQAAPKISKSVDVPSKAIIHESCVLVVRTGSIGTAVKVHELDKGCAISSHLIRLEFNDEETAAAVAVFLNSAAGKVLLHKISYGAVQPQIGQEELLALSIPEYVLNDKAKCLSLLNSYELAVRASANLTTAAKTLVEALIEGQLTEQQLIQAQQSLDDGDNSLDQVILSKLSNEGYAIDGATPLFSDLDELYRLLKSAAQAETEE